MKEQEKQIVRTKWTQKFCDFLEGIGEDVGYIATNSINFPITYEGKEGWIELVVKIPKVDEGYEKREEYELTVKRRKEEEEKKAIAKAKKIKRDEKRREEQGKEQEAK